MWLLAAETATDGNVLDAFLVRHIAHASWTELAITFGVLGLCTGLLIARWLRCLVLEQSFWKAGPCPECGQPLRTLQQIPVVGELLWQGRCPRCRQGRWQPSLALAVLTALLFAGLALGILHYGTQAANENGSIDHIHYRVLYHLALVALLIAASAIDLDYYIIPDEITILGTILGVAGATLNGNLQLVPLWIDWNHLLADLHGGYIPEWIKLHEHWHGLTWSLAGLVTGAGLTWLVRALSCWILGVEAMGFGDVTLMAMIGSFLGWQPVVCAFLLAPLCGAVLGPVLQFSVGRIAVPFGPYLCAGAGLVLFSWHWIWRPLRTIFGHPPTLALLAGCSCGALIGLLALLRLYRAIPIPARQQREEQPPPSP